MTEPQEGRKPLPDVCPECGVDRPEHTDEESGMWVTCDEVQAATEPTP